MAPSCDDENSNLTKQQVPANAEEWGRDGENEDLWARKFATTAEGGRFEVTPVPLMFLW